MLQKKRTMWIFLFLVPTMVLFLLIYGAPIVTLFTTSLFDYKIYPNKFQFIGLMNYINLFFKDPTFLTALSNTLVWVVVHCAVNISIGVIVALVLMKKPFGWKFVRTIYMVPNIISSAAIGIIFLNLFNPQYGALNSIIRLFGNKNFSVNWLFDSSTAFGSVTFTWILLQFRKKYSKLREWTVRTTSRLTFTLRFQCLEMSLAQQLLWVPHICCRCLT